MELHNTSENTRSSDVVCSDPRRACTRIEAARGAAPYLPDTAGAKQKLAL